METIKVSHQVLTDDVFDVLLKTPIIQVFFNLNFDQSDNLFKKVEKIADRVGNLNLGEEDKNSQISKLVEKLGLGTKLTEMGEMDTDNSNLKLFYIYEALVNSGKLGELSRSHSSQYGSPDFSENSLMVSLDTELPNFDSLNFDLLESGDIDDELEGSEEEKNALEAYRILRNNNPNLTNQGLYELFSKSSLFDGLDNNEKSIEGETSKDNERTLSERLLEDFESKKGYKKFLENL